MQTFIQAFLHVRFLLGLLQPIPAVNALLIVHRKAPIDQALWPLGFGDVPSAERPEVEENFFNPTVGKLHNYSCKKRSKMILE